MRFAQLRYSDYFYIQNNDNYFAITSRGEALIVHAFTIYLIYPHLIYKSLYISSLEVLFFLQNFIDFSPILYLFHSWEWYTCVIILIVYFFPFFFVFTRICFLTNRSDKNFRCTFNDLKMIVRLIKHDLRINAGPKHMWVCISVRFRIL